jgi:hypothetical protein
METVGLFPFDGGGEHCELASPIWPLKPFKQRPHVRGVFAQAFLFKTVQFILEGNVQLTSSLKARLRALIKPTLLELPKPPLDKIAVAVDKITLGFTVTCNCFNDRASKELKTTPIVSKK